MGPRGGNRESGAHGRGSSGSRAVCRSHRPWGEVDVASGSPDNEGKEEGVPEESWPKKLLLIPSSSDVLGQYASARCVPPEVPSCHLASSLLCLTRSPGHTCVLSNTDLNIKWPLHMCEWSASLTVREMQIRTPKKTFLNFSNQQNDS